MDKKSCTPWNTYNLSNEYVAESIFYTSFERLNLLAITPCILTLGIVSNLIFLVTVFRLQRMQTVTNFYLSALAICDLVLLISGQPILIIAYFKSVGRLFQFSFLRNKYDCIAIFSTTAISYYTSLVIVSMVSSERFYAICNPLQHKAIAGKSRTLKLIFGALAMGLIFTVINAPCFAVFSSFCVIWPNTDKYADMPTTGGRCGPTSFTYYIYQELFTIILFITLFIYNSSLYVMIVVTLSRRSVMKDSGDNPQADKIRNQVARVLILNGLVFFLCQGPYR